MDACGGFVAPGRCIRTFVCVPGAHPPLTLGSTGPSLCQGHAGPVYLGPDSPPWPTVLPLGLSRCSLPQSQVGCFPQCLSRC